MTEQNPYLEDTKTKDQGFLPRDNLQGDDQTLFNQEIALSDSNSEDLDKEEEACLELKDRQDLEGSNFHKTFNEIQAKCKNLTIYFLQIYCFFFK